MPTIQISLKGSAFPCGNTLKEIHREGLYCVSCGNLSPATAMVLIPRHGLEMSPIADVNMAAAERVGMLDPPPMWVDRARNHRPDYYSFSLCSLLVDIIETARKGCPSCTLIERAIGTLYPRFIPFDDPRLAVHLKFSSGRVLFVYVYYYDPPVYDSDSDDHLSLSTRMGPLISTNGHILEVIEIYTLPGKRSPWPTIGRSIPFSSPESVHQQKIGGIARHITANPGLESGSDLIKSWLDGCVNDHIACREADSKAGHQLPKRVIDVGSNDNTTICLHENDERPGDLVSHYVALSHCWGQKPLPRLTRDTLKDKKVNISWESLTKTFQDVIIVARGIGVKYVWIDSLCIIQDDTADWETEAAKMGTIYEGALVVIAATAATDGTGGCLFEKEPYLEIQATIQGHEPFRVFAREKPSHGVFMSRLDRGEPIEDPISDESTSREYPLFSRAWCYQERLLGTRVIHFLREEMVFECLETLDCECGMLHGYVENAMRQLRKAVRLDKVPEFQDLRSKEDDKWRSHLRKTSYVDEEFLTYEEDVFDAAWRRVVETYSQRQITFRADTFPALSGIANRWSRMSKKRYLCGLWADGNGLLFSLMWYVRSKGAKPENREKKAQSNVYIAPSWSWASTQQEVSWGDPYYDESKYLVEIDVRNCNCLCSGLDPFGKVTCGWIVITGKVMSIQETMSRPPRLGTYEQTLLRKFGSISDSAPDDEVARSESIGKNLVYLLWAENSSRWANRNYTAMILAPVDLGDNHTGDIDLVPEHLKTSSKIYRRIGMTRRPWDEWAFQETLRLETVVII
ncbi:heterokaryon incompatibility protein-domain-containing protein [Xylaria venustula]|nr:heterokaryon incompatibility protein-domain-containing protein [Xylaria venustula]